MDLRNVLPRREIVIGSLLLAVTAFAWLDVIRSASMMMPMPEMEPLSVGAMLAFTVQWGIMMTAMMLPSAAPMILLYNGATRRGTESGERFISSEVFALTYVVSWLLTGVPVYLAWVAVAELAARSNAFAAAIPYTTAATLLGAGVYQLTDAKHACLRECQSPVDFLMRRWRSGYLASLRLAAAHSAYCIGCCWALMILLVVAGAMSLPWVLAIALIVFAEKVLPRGERTARITGITLIAAAMALTIWPSLAGDLSSHGR